MKHFLLAASIALALATAPASQAATPIFSQDFDSVTGLNNDDPIISDATGAVTAGLTGWSLMKGTSAVQIAPSVADFYFDDSSDTTLPAETGAIVPLGAKAIKGKFNPTAGPELLENGSFDTNTGWTAGDATWTYNTGTQAWDRGAGANATGKLTYAGSNAGTIIQAGHVYQLTVNMTSSTGYACDPYVGTTKGTSMNSVKVWTQYFLAKGTATLYFQPNNKNSKFSIDDISLKEITGGSTNFLVSPTFTLPTSRSFTTKAKFAVLGQVSGNDTRLALDILGYMPVATGNNPMQSSVALKINQGDTGTMNTKDLEGFAHSNVSADGTINVPMAASRTDDTDYRVGVWNNVEIACTIDAVNNGVARFRVNGKRFSQDIKLKPLNDTLYGNGAQFALIGWDATVGTVLFDDLEVSDGLTDYPVVQALDGTTDITSGATVKFGTVTPGVIVEKTITITNKSTGTANLVPGSLNVSGDFSLKTALPGGSIAPGASATFVVKMTSDTTGNKTGTITFANNDMDITINLSGKVSAITSAKHWVSFK